MPTFEILCVCTGNICRSPLAERLLRARLQGAGSQVADQFHVHSAGVGALVDEPMDAQAAVVLAGLGGGDANGFVSRQVQPALVAGAGLVLTAERSHRSRLLQELPTAMRRTFTLREFAGLCGSLDGADLAGIGPEELVRRAAAKRGSLLVEDYDIPDPFRRGDAEHQAAGKLIGDAIDVIARALVAAATVRR